jgi:endo-1,4-beta-mannosidase
MTYIKEAHGGVFRRVALSGLLESASRPHKKEPNTQTTRVIRYASYEDMEIRDLWIYVNACVCVHVCAYLLVKHVIIKIID